MHPRREQRVNHNAGAVDPVVHVPQEHNPVILIRDAALWKRRNGYLLAFALRWEHHSAPRKVHERFDAGIIRIAMLNVLLVGRQMARNEQASCGANRQGNTNSALVPKFVGKATRHRS